MIGGRCPALTSVSSPASGIQHEVGERGQLDRAHRGEQPVEQVDHGGGLMTLERVGAQRRAHLRHQRAGLHPAPDDVADHERDPAAAELEHVVPVAADAGVDGGREVARREQDARDHRQRARQHRPLHRLHDVALRVQARVLDRDRGAVGGELEQVALLVGEVPRRQRADVQHPDHAPLDEQRHPQQRADALLAQDRVEDVRVVDVLDRDGPALGGDPPGEAAPDRDPHAAPRPPPRCPWRPGPRGRRRPRRGAGTLRCRSRGSRRCDRAARCSSSSSVSVASAASVTC